MATEEWGDMIEQIIDTFLPTKEITIELKNSHLLMGNFSKHYFNLKLIIKNKHGCLARKLEQLLIKEELELINNETTFLSILLDRRIHKILIAA